MVCLKQNKIPHVTQLNNAAVAYNSYGLVKKIHKIVDARKILHDGVDNH